MSAGSLQQYDRHWKQLIGREIKLGYWARRAASRLSDSQIEKAVQAVREDGLFNFARKRAWFDWHRELMSYLLQLPAVRDVVSTGGG